MADNAKALDDIFKSIDIIIDGRLQGLKFDKTIDKKYKALKNGDKTADKINESLKNLIIKSLD